MEIIIENHKTNYIITSRFGVSHFNLKNAVKDKLKTGEELTNATALRIFKQIKFKSDMISLLTKKTVLVPLSISLILAGFSLTVLSMTAIGMVAGVFLAALGVGLLNAIAPSQTSDHIVDISQIYAGLSSEAAEYINRIENSGEEIKFKFAPEPLEVLLASF